MLDAEKQPPAARSLRAVENPQFTDLRLEVK
jgi:hypothetical protein